MKRQINKGSGNLQESDDDTTTQIQIGSGLINKVVFATVFAMLVVLIIIFLIGLDILIDS